MKAPNAERARPTVTVALPDDLLERMRELAWARGVSLSQVARDALELAFARWERQGAPPAISPDPDGSPKHWPRELRRQAAREGRLAPEDDR